MGLNISCDPISHGDYMFLRNGELFDINVSHVFDDIQFPANFFLDADSRTQYGITEVPDPVIPDLNFFTYTQRIDGSLEITNRSVPDVQAILKNTVANRRYDIEVGGVTFNNTVLPSDRTTRKSIAAELNGMQSSGAATLNWKFNSNLWVTFTLTELTALNVLYSTHVQKCFDMEFNAKTIIDNTTTFTALQQLDLDVLCQII